VAPPAFVAASFAVTVIWFAPAASAMLAMLQLLVPLALPLVPFAALLHVTLVTPTLSLAVPLSATLVPVVEKVPEALGEVIATVGAVVSAGPPGVEVTVSVAPLAFVAASFAVTVIWFVPAASAMLAMLQLLVPLAMPLVPFAALLHVTFVTPTLSLAVPLNATLEPVVEKVPEALGEVIATVGAVVSGGGPPPPSAAATAPA